MDALFEYHTQDLLLTFNYLSVAYCILSFNVGYTKDVFSGKHPGKHVLLYDIPTVTPTLVSPADARLLQSETS